MENSLHRVGIFQQNLEHPRSVRDLGHLIDPHARVLLLNLSPNLRFSVFSHVRLDLAEKNRLRSEEIKEREGGKIKFRQGLDGGGF